MKNKFAKTTVTIDFGYGVKREFTICEANGGDIRTRGNEIHLVFTHPNFGENLHAIINPKGTHFK